MKCYFPYGELNVLSQLMTTKEVLLAPPNNVFSFNTRHNFRPSQRDKIDNSNIMVVLDKKKHGRVDKSAKNIPTP